MPKNARSPEPPQGPRPPRQPQDPGASCRGCGQAVTSCSCRVSGAAVVLKNVQAGNIVIKNVGR